MSGNNAPSTSATVTPARGRAAIAAVRAMRMWETGSMALPVLSAVCIPVPIELVPEVRIRADAPFELRGEILRRGVDGLIHPARRVDDDRIAELADETAVGLPDHECRQQRRARQARDHRRRAEKARGTSEE